MNNQIGQVTMGRGWVEIGKGDHSIGMRVDRWSLRFWLALVRAVWQARDV